MAGRGDAKEESGENEPCKIFFLAFLACAGDPKHNDELRSLQQLVVCGEMVKFPVPGKWFLIKGRSSSQIKKHLPWTKAQYNRTVGVGDLRGTLLFCRLRTTAKPCIHTRENTVKFILAETLVQNDNGSGNPK